MKKQEPADEKLFRAIANVIPVTQRGVVGIFGNVGKRLHPVGSAVLLRVGEETIVVTAAHALHEGLTTTESLAVLAGQHGAPLSGRAYTIHDRAAGVGRYGLDVAVTRLDRVAAAAFPPDFPLTVDELGIGNTPDIYTLCCAVGYPATRNKLRLPHHPITLATYTGWGVDASEYRVLQKDPRAEVLFRFFRTRMYNEQFVPVVAPDPHGVSGGAVWSLGTVDDANIGLARPHFIGIATGWDVQRELLIATHVHVAIAIIRDRMPELSSFLPTTNVPMSLSFTPSQA